MKTIFSFLLVTVGLMLLFTQCEKDPDINPNDPIDIPDLAFLNALIEGGYDTNGDGQISYAEADTVTYLILSFLEISDLTGIEAFVSLDSLRCEANNLTSLNLSRNKALRHVHCGVNQLTNLDLSNCADLEYLDCRINPLGNLDVSENIHLRYLCCNETQLSSLDVSKNTELWYLYCRENQLTSIDISNNPQLGELICWRNQLTSLDLSNNRIYTLYCGDNQISTLDLSNLNLTYLGCSGNLLTQLDVSTCTALLRLYIENMPSLYEVCLPSSFIYGDPFIWTDGSPNLVFTTECSQ